MGTRESSAFPVIVPAGFFAANPLTGTQSQASLFDKGGTAFNVISYGLKGDLISDSHGVMTINQPVLTSSANPFKATDVGKGITVSGAGSGASVLATTILSYQSAGQVTLATNALTAVSGVDITWFTDNSAALATIWPLLPALGVASGGNNANVGIIDSPPGGFGFISQATVPKGTTVAIRGGSRGATMWYYGGSVQQTFLLFAGGNQGSRMESMCICGPWADPAWNIQSNIGGGDTYSVFVNVIDCYIGFCLTGKGSVPNAAFMSYSGANIQCDVFGAVGTAFYGRNYGCRLRVGCTDAYFSNGCVFSANTQGGEPRCIGLWCEDADAPTLFSGTVHISNCNAALGIEAAVLLRSVANVYGLYIETAKLPVKLVSCQAKIFGGKIATNDVTATHLITATGSTGCIYYPLLAGPTPANALLDLINITGSPRNNSWDIFLNPKGSIIGTLPATLLSVDTPNFVSWPGVATKMHTAADVAFAASYTPDWSLTEEVSMTLTANITVNNPNPGFPPWPGAHMRFIWKFGGAGGWTITYGTFYKTAGGSTPALVTTTGTITIDDFVFEANTSNWRLASRTTGQTV